MLITQIYLDMDGVLVDLYDGIKRLFDKCPKYDDIKDYDFNYEKDFGMTRQQFWSQLRHTFWSNLRPTVEMEGILELLHSRGVEDITCLLSSPTLEPGSWSGKAEWVKKNLPNFYHGKRFILSHDKLWNVHPNALLIDDRWETCCNWENAGGQAFIFPRPWNPAHEYEGVALKGLELYLDSLGVKRP